MTDRTTEVIIGTRCRDDSSQGGRFWRQRAQRELASALREYRLEQPHAGWQARSGERAGRHRRPCRVCSWARRGKVVAISVSTAMHGLLGLDAQYRPLTQLVTWADSPCSRGGPSIASTRPSARAAARSGTPVHPMSPLVKLVWFSRHEPGWRPGALVGRPQGPRAAPPHRRTGHRALQRFGDWAAQSEEPQLGRPIAGLGRYRCRPAAISAANHRGAQADRAGCGSSDCPWGARRRRRGDGPLGNLGTGAITPGVAGLSLGTSGAVRMVLSESQDSTTQDGCSAMPSLMMSWVIGGAISNGGITLRWARETFAPDRPGRRRSRRCRCPSACGTGAAGSEGLLMLPYVLSERAPLWDPDLAGAYL